MKHRLDIPEPGEETALFGLACHEADHRLCWALNRKLGLRMERMEGELEYRISGSEGHEEKTCFSLFSWAAEEDHVTYSLIGNRSEKGALIPKRKELDHFFMIEAHEERDDLDLMDELRTVGPILAVFRIDPSTLPSVGDLMV